MALLDIRTIVIANALSTAVCLVALYAIRLDARDARATTMWAWAYALLLLNWLLVALRGTASDIVSIVLANTLGVAGLTLAYLGLRRFFDTPTVRWPSIAPVVLVAVFLTFFTYVQPNLAWRNIVVAAGVTAVGLEAAWFLFTRKGVPLKAAGNRVALTFLWLCIVALARVAREFVLPRDGEFMQPDVFDAVILAAWGIGLIALAFTLILLVNVDLVVELQTDIRCRKSTEQKLRRLSELDELTGLLNGRAFRSAGAELLSRPDPGPVQVVYFDLDSLKSINDELGHAAGDEAIRAFAAVLRRSFRESDVIGRLGGDEFAVVAASRRAVPGSTLLSRYHSEIASERERTGLAHRLDASYGIASWAPDDGPPPKLQTLVTEADARMYARKALRHNQAQGSATASPT